MTCQFQGKTGFGPWSWQRPPIARLLKLGRSRFSDSSIFSGFPTRPRSSPWIGSVRKDVAGMELKTTVNTVLRVALECFMDDPERQGLPGNLLGVEQPDFQAFASGLELQV